jgi:hypothetical protein
MMIELIIGNIHFTTFTSSSVEPDWISKKFICNVLVVSNVLFCILYDFIHENI